MKSKKKKKKKRKKNLYSRCAISRPRSVVPDLLQHIFNKSDKMSRTETKCNVTIPREQYEYQVVKRSNQDEGKKVKIVCMTKP